MDFYRIKERPAKNGVVEIYPDFRIGRSEDLMIRGRSFYAIWDQAKGLWSTDEYDVQRLVDEDLTRYKDDRMEKQPGVYQVKYLGDYSTNSWLQFRNYIMHLSDNSHQLDENLTFSNTEVTRKDYVSRRLPYPLQEGNHSSFTELLSVLYTPPEREKLEWAIGAVVAGDSKHIQKFLVLYGSAGTGKSTYLNIVQKLFEGYYTTFEAKSLTGNNNSFATEVFRANPLVAIQHDGDLSKIEDNTKLNSIVSHEEMTFNEKYKPSYDSKVNAFLFMGTNKPVKITDAKSGIIRRLIDVQPTGDKVPARKYQSLYSQIDFELGAIAYYCLSVYRELGKDYYSSYRPVEMMLQTDIFFNFIEANFDIFKSQGGVTLNAAYEMYRQFCEESEIEFKMPKYKMREELKNYFDNFDERMDIDGARVRSWYSGFNAEHFKSQTSKEPKVFSLVMDESESIFDKEMAALPAQYAKKDETPQNYWDQVKTTLDDLDTSVLHYVKVPENHIVIDFDLTDASGKKSAERNLEAASLWPPTYAEYSKSGAGIHLHYNYEGDLSEVNRLYDEGIEIKIFTGKTSLRRRLSKCNNIPVATINSGLPLREKKVINSDQVKSERALRELIMRNLRKEIHAGTKPSIDFIKKILDDAYASDLSYDLTDLRPKVMSFANNSTHNAQQCLAIFMEMQFKSKDVEVELAVKPDDPGDNRIVYFDVEVYPNLFMVCWKYKGSDTVVRLINPKPTDIENLSRLRLVGFNNRHYDNHIMYARIMGYDNARLYDLSQRIINNSPNSMFREAYNLSYADIYDYSSKKQSLKKFEIELGIKHMESDIPWDQPVSDEDIPKIEEYCVNDVIATEKVAEDREGDFIARQILAELSGLGINDSTAAHTSAIIFGKNNRRPQEDFVYTQLSEMFPGYTFDKYKSQSTYKGEETGEGGYVYSEPGMYHNVALLDVASMHPTSIEQLNLFGKYTQNFSDLKAARIAIKRRNYDEARTMLGGKLAPYLVDESNAEALSYALKIVINIVYGLTSARFDNSFRDPRNIDNIVAKRGALFMIDLKEEVQKRGFTVAHIKTDSIKIPEATPEIIQFVTEFGRRYGYDFEHEMTYDRLCLVNDAVYVAHKDEEFLKLEGKSNEGDPKRGWTATGAQFQHPFVFKKLFSHEDIVFRDLCEAKSVKTAMYLDFNEGDEEIPMALTLDENKRHFVGKTGLFTPIKTGRGGGQLLRASNEEGKFHAVTGTRNYRWLEAQMVESLEKFYDVDQSYFDKLANDAVDDIGKFGDVEAFTA